MMIMSLWIVVDFRVTFSAQICTNFKVNIKTEHSVETHKIIFLKNLEMAAAMFCCRQSIAC